MDSFYCPSCFQVHDYPVSVVVKELGNLEVCSNCAGRIRILPDDQFEFCTSDGQQFSSLAALKEYKKAHPHVLVGFSADSCDISDLLVLEQLCCECLQESGLVWDPPRQWWTDYKARIDCQVQILFKRRKICEIKNVD